MGITMKKKTHTGGIPIREYNRIHRWVGRHWEKKKQCEKCGSKGYTHWSNKDQKYTQIRKDWQELCPTCHVQYDRQKFGHTWKKYGRPRLATPKLPRADSLETFDEALPRLRTYEWFTSREFDNLADVSILINMRDNVYIKQKYWKLWRELKDQGKIPELLDKLLEKEYKGKK